MIGLEEQSGGVQRRNTSQGWAATHRGSRGGGGWAGKEGGRIVEGGTGKKRKAEERRRVG